MPLSEREQRLLEQMERALHAEDPKFASALQGDRLRRRLHWKLAAAIFIALIAAAGVGYGVYSGRLAAVIAGSVVFVIGVWFAWVVWRKVPARGQIVRPSRPKKRARDGRPRGTFMQRMESRWQHRRERDHF